MAILSGALLMAPLCAAYAQNAASESYPAPAKTPEAAGERFYQFLEAGAVKDRARSEFDLAKAARYAGSLSRAQAEAISKQSYDNLPGGILELMTSLAAQKDEPQFEARAVGKEGEATLVEVAPAPARKRAVVVVPEDGGYRVDLKATYARWNELSGEELDIAWADFTGIVSPELAKNTAFVEKRQLASCQTNLKQLMLGILQYSQDYNETLPPARKWMDVIQPYVRSEQILHCPALTDPKPSEYGYALNQNLSGIRQSKLDNVAQTVAIYETDALERNAFGAGEERAYRHGGGSNIAFADGHIKWFAEGQEPEAQVQFKP